MESKKYNKIVNITEKDADSQNKLVVTSGGGAIYGWGSGRHKLLGIRQAQGCVIQHGNRVNIL